MLTRDQVRALDRCCIEEFGLPGIVLMENAGRGAAEVLMRLDPIRRLVVIVCGKGNNAGDGFVMARHLDAAGYPVRLICPVEPTALSPDARMFAEVAQRAGLTIQPHLDLKGAAWVVDALFGTGLTGSIHGFWAEWVEAIQAASVPVLAIDLPSGLDADTGQPLGPTVRAEHTVTFVSAKCGFAQPSAHAYLGTVHVVGIGAPRVLLERFGLTVP